MAPLVRRDLKESELFGLFNAREARGRVWGVPGILQEAALYYHTAAFDEVGLKYPTPEWTLDDLQRAATRLTDAAKQQYGFFLQPSYITTSWYVFPRLFGADVLDAARDELEAAWKGEVCVPAAAANANRRVQQIIDEWAAATK